MPLTELRHLREQWLQQAIVVAREKHQSCSCLLTIPKTAQESHYKAFFSPKSSRKSSRSLNMKGLPTFTFQVGLCSTTALWLPELSSQATPLKPISDSQPSYGTCWTLAVHIKNLLRTPQERNLPSLCRITESVGPGTHLHQWGGSHLPGVSYLEGKA